MENSNVLDQMKNMKPEDWSNFRKAQIQGEINLIKNAPWYYKAPVLIFVALFAIAFFGFIIFFISRIQEAYKFNQQFNQEFNKAKGNY